MTKMKPRIMINTNKILALHSHHPFMTIRRVKALMKINGSINMGLKAILLDTTSKTEKWMKEN